MKTKFSLLFALFLVSFVFYECNKETSVEKFPTNQKTVFDRQLETEPLQWKQTPNLDLKISEAEQENVKAIFYELLDLNDSYPLEVVSTFKSYKDDFSDGELLYFRMLTIYSHLHNESVSSKSDSYSQALFNNIVDLEKVEYDFNQYCIDEYGKIFIRLNIKNKAEAAKGFNYLDKFVNVSPAVSESASHCGISGNLTCPLINYNTWVEEGEANDLSVDVIDCVKNDTSEIFCDWRLNYVADDLDRRDQCRFNWHSSSAFLRLDIINCYDGFLSFREDPTTVGQYYHNYEVVVGICIGFFYSEPFLMNNLKLGRTLCQITTTTPPDDID